MRASTTSGQKRIFVALAILFSAITANVVGGQVAAVPEASIVADTIDIFDDFEWERLPETEDVEADTPEGRLKLVELEVNDGVTRTFDTSHVIGEQGAMLINLSSWSDTAGSLTIQVNGVSQTITPPDSDTYPQPVSIPFGLYAAQTAVTISAADSWFGTEVEAAVELDDFQLVIKSNPDLDAACGVDLQVVLDESGSIGDAPGDADSDANAVRQGVRDLVDALQGTNTQIRFTEFSTAGRKVNLANNTPSSGGWRMVDDSLGADIEEYLTGVDVAGNATAGSSYSPDGATNWEGGFNELTDGQEFGRPTRPDLILFITDGVPNHWNVDDGSDPAATAGESKEYVPHAVLQAQRVVDDLQAENFHILGVGVGNAAKEENIKRLAQLIDPAAAEIASPGNAVNMSTADVYNATQDFNMLSEAMSNLVYSLCSPQVSIAKLDQDGKPVVDWVFEGAVDVSPTGDGDVDQYEWKNPAVAGPTADNGTGSDIYQPLTVDATTGIAVFDWVPNTRAEPEMWLSTFRFRETLKPGWILDPDTPTTCKVYPFGNDDPASVMDVGLSWTQTGNVVDFALAEQLDRTDQVFCTVQNERQATLTIIKDAQPADGTDFNFAVTEPTGSDQVADTITLDDDTDPTLNDTYGPITIAAGRYTVEEMVPANWSLSNLKCDKTNSGVTTTVATGRQQPVVLNPVAGDDIVCTFTNVANPAFDVTKDVVGRTAKFLGNNTYEMGYTIVVANSGLDAGQYDLVDTPNFGAGTTITDIKVNGRSVGASTPVTLASDRTLAAGASDRYELLITFKVPGVLAIAEANCQSGNNGAGSGTYNSVTVTSQAGSDFDDACGSIPQLDLKIEKTDNGAVGIPGGDSFDYMIKVTNVSSRDADPAEPVTVTDHLPDGLSWVTVPNGCTTSGQTMTCDLDPKRLTVGASVELVASVAADVGTKAGNYTNVVWVDTTDDPQCAEGDCLKPPDCPTGAAAPITGTPNPANNVDCEPTPVDTPGADMAIRKSSNIDEASLDGEFVWVLDVKNLGPATAEDVVVTDSLPDQVRFVEVSSDVFDCSYAEITTTVTCSTESIEPGATAQISIRAVALASGTTRNVATVGSSTPDLNTDNNTDDDEITVNVGVLPPTPVVPSPVIPGPAPAGPQAQPPPTPAPIELPVTGSDGRGVLLAGLILLALGTVTLASAKRRRYRV